MEKLKIAGAWSGVIEADLHNWTVSMLRQEVANRSSSEPESINLICAGKLLKDDDSHQNLSELGVKNNARILATRVCTEQRVELVAEEERSIRLSRIKAASMAMTERHADGSLPIEDFNLELEDQSGSKVDLGSETDQRAVMMGLMLHAKSKQLIRLHKYKDALEVLTMGEEAFSLCNPKVIELVDNVPMLQIDMVWCYFMLRDIKCLSQAGIRLANARKGIERAHGKDFSRVRALQAGRFPEVALYLRLELLEGVVAYYSGQHEKSRSLLTSAQARYSQLQVPDDVVAVLVSMGYKEHKATRALRMSNQDIPMAIDFLVEENVKKQERREEDIRRRNEIAEQKRYGMTALKKAVNLKRVEALVSLGYEKVLAAEALRRNENDTDKALDDLTNPETNAAIQTAIESKKRKRKQKEADAAIEELVSMGFERSIVVAAVQASGTVDGALSHLLTQVEANSNDAIDPNLTSMTNNNDQGLASSSEINNNNDQGLASSSEINNNSYSEEGPANTSGRTDERDMEMEDELTQEIENSDAVSDYDIDVTKEGEAISEYLALLDAVGNSNDASSSKK